MSFAKTAGIAPANFQGNACNKAVELKLGGPVIPPHTQTTVGTSQMEFVRAYLCNGRHNRGLASSWQL